MSRVYYYYYYYYYYYCCCYCYTFVLNYRMFKICSPRLRVLYLVRVLYLITPNLMVSAQVSVLGVVENNRMLVMPLPMTRDRTLITS